MDQKEEHEIDFRVPGTVTCSCKRSRKFPSSRACRRTENHPDRDAFQADLKQNNVYNPFSNNSKEMIRKLGNVEFFKLW